MEESAEPSRAEQEERGIKARDLRAAGEHILIQAMQPHRVMPMSLKPALLMYIQLWSRSC